MVKRLNRCKIDLKPMLQSMGSESIVAKCSTNLRWIGRGMTVEAAESQAV